MLDQVEGLAKEFDIKVAIHNHGPEDKLYPAPGDAYKLIQKRDKRMGLCIDVGHTVRCGVEPHVAVKECRGRLFDLHLKDLKSKTDKDSQVRVGRGALDVPAIFRALLAIPFAGHVALEYEVDAEDPRAGPAGVGAVSDGSPPTSSTAGPAHPGQVQADARVTGASDNSADRHVGRGQRPPRRGRVTS